MFGFLKKTISVSFVDDQTGLTFASSELPLDRLPDTFVLETTLDMAGGQYVVVGADPPTKEAFAKSKRLTVRLRRVERMDPKTILFSMPSICASALPECERVEVSAAVPVLHEDDWRQCELVAATHASDISAELADIREIHANASEASGWRKAHARQRIPKPLPEGMTWSEVTKHLTCAIKPVSGVAFRPSDWTGSGPTVGAVDAVVNAVAGSFDDGVLLWGVEDDGELSVLCVENVDTASVQTIEALRRLADALSLVVVHWCRCQAYAPKGTVIENALGEPWD